MSIARAREQERRSGWCSRVVSVSTFSRRVRRHLRHERKLFLFFQIGRLVCYLNYDNEELTPCAERVAHGYVVPALEMSWVGWWWLMVVAVLLAVAVVAARHRGDGGGGDGGDCVGGGGGGGNGDVNVHGRV